jgi:hypothetical protein
MAQSSGPGMSKNEALPSAAARQMKAAGVGDPGP